MESEANGPQNVHNNVMLSSVIVPNQLVTG